MNFFCFIIFILSFFAKINAIERANLANKINCNTFENIDKLLDYFLENSSTVGIAVGTINDNQLQYYLKGLNSIENNIPISEDSIFEIGSISKIFTTLLLMDQVAKGKICLNDPIEKFLPDVKIPSKNNKKITFNHLLTHTSALPRLPNNLVIGSLENPYKNYDIKELYDFLNNYQLTHIPGTKYEYSNLGIALLGHILTLMTNSSYESLLNTVICKELNLKNTSIFLDNARKKNMAQAYHMKNPVSNWDFKVFEGAGGILSNIKDMTLFLKTCMNLEENYLSKLLCDSYKKKHEISLNLSMGLGWHIFDSIIFHDGATGGYRSFIGFDINKSKGIVVLSNSTENLASELGLFFLDHEKFPIIQTELRSDFLDVNYLKQFIGNFQIDIPEKNLKQVFQIKLFGNQLVVDLSSVFHLIPVKKNIFQLKGLPNHLWKFIFNEDNKLIKLEISQPDGTYEANYL
jgi:CubicO group peptidase (beta-lactamase class C family)